MNKPLLKSLFFLVVVPGIVAGVVPYLLLPEAAVEGARVVTPLRVVAVLLGLAGALLVVRCVLGFALEGRGTPAPIDPPKELVVRGPYRWSRNPMYVGVLSVLAAEALYFGSWRLAAYTAVLFLTFHLFVVFYEEPTLTRLFGESYERYRASVPRWIGVKKWEVRSEK